MKLYHHGIKGQKWGIRRYQNEDGTLTDAGKKRYYSTSHILKHPIQTLIAKNSTKQDKTIAALGITGAFATTMAMVYLTPKLIDKGSSILFKYGSKTINDIDLDNLGPTIFDKHGNVITDPEILDKYL